VAGRVLEAVRADRFWVITHPEERPIVEARFAGVMNDFPTERTSV
jgi:hypothetical protein